MLRVSIDYIYDLYYDYDKDEIKDNLISEKYIRLFESLLSTGFDDFFIRYYEKKWENREFREFLEFLDNTEPEDFLKELGLNRSERYIVLQDYL